MPTQVTLGNGSNDLLVLLAEAFLTPGTNAVHSQFAFAIYGAVHPGHRRARSAWPRRMPPTIAMAHGP